MLIVVEADRLKPETFPDVRDINDKLEIAVVLVGTARFKIPALWEDGCCDRCRLLFVGMIAYQKAI